MLFCSCLLNPGNQQPSHPTCHRPMKRWRSSSCLKSFFYWYGGGEKEGGERGTYAARRECREVYTERERERLSIRVRRRMAAKAEVVREIGKQSIVERVIEEAVREGGRERTAEKSMVRRRVKCKGGGKARAARQSR